MSLIYNNPGNIRPGQDYAGETGEFYTASDGSKYVVFDSPEMGLRALFIDLRSKITQFNGDIDQIVNKYAPPTDNNPTTRYASFVKGKLGKNVVTEADLPDLVSAFVSFENKKSVASQYLKPNLLQTAQKLSAVSMPKETRLADAMQQVGLEQPAAPSEFSVEEAAAAQFRSRDDLPTGQEFPGSPQPSASTPSVVPPQPDARAARVQRLTDAAKQDDTDLAILEERQQPAVVEDSPVSDIALQASMIQEPQQSELRFDESGLDRNLIEDRQKPAVAGNVVQDDSGIVVTARGPETDEPSLDIQPPEAVQPQVAEPQAAPLARAPIQPETAETRILRQRAEKQAREDVTFGDAAKAAFAEENIMSWVYRNAEEFTPDPDFKLEKDAYDKLVKDIPEEYRDFLFEATSLAHAEALREQVLISMENEEILQQYGWSGVGLRVVATMLDPAAIGVTVLTEGVAAPLIWGNKATRLSRAFRGAFGGAVSTGAIEAYLVSQNAVKDPYDILYGMAGGLVLGGGIGAALGKSQKEFNAALSVVDASARQAQVADIGAVVQRRIAEQQTAIPRAAFDTFDTGVGAMQNPMSISVQIPDLSTRTDDFLNDIGEPAFASMATMAGGRIPLRFDISGQLKADELNSMRQVGNILAEDAVGFNQQGELMQSTADILKTNAMKAGYARYYQVYRPAFNEWAESEGIGYLRRQFGSTRAQFGELVADAIENPGLQHHPQVVRAAKRQAELFRDVLRRAKKAGVKGFDEIPEDLTYFTHLWSPYKVRVMVENGEDKVVDLLKTSLVRGTEGLDEDLANEIATKMVKKLRNAHAGMDSGLARVFTSDQKDTLRDILIEEDILDPDAADRLVALFDRPRTGLPSRAKQRLKIDINAEIPLENGNILRVKDLMDRDAEQVFSSYLTQMEGRIALAQKGIRSEADYNALVKTIKDEADTRYGADAPDKIKGNLENIDVLYNMILGRSSPLITDPGATSARLARLFQDYNFIRLMNQVGFAQVAELGNALSIGGVRGLMQVVPEFRSMLKRAKNGELEDAVARDLEAFAGIGADRLIHQAMNRYDAQDMFVMGRGDFIDRASFGIQPIKRIVADISGMAPVTLALERAAGRMAVQTIVDASFKGGFSKSLQRRMTGMGVDEAMAKKIFDQIKEHAVTVPSSMFRNRKVKSINMGQWTDEEARDAFIVAVSRWTRRSIQQNDLGNLNRYMTTTMGKMLTQFRTFMLVSHAKQTLHGLKANDVRGYAAMMTSVFFAGASYVAQTSLNAQFREDKREFLDERLSMKNIGLSAFQRSSWAALIPAMVDTGAAFYTEDPIFAYGRSSGLATNFLTGVPMIDLAQKAHTVASGASRAIINPDYQWSQGQQRALNSIIPLQNAIGIKNAMNKLVDIQPRYDNLD